MWKNIFLNSKTIEAPQKRRSQEPEKRRGGTRKRRVPLEEKIFTRRCCLCRTVLESVGGSRVEGAETSPSTKQFPTKKVRFGVI